MIYFNSRQLGFQYRSPEECLAKPLTEKVDVYSLGHVFYTILTGYTPYTYPTQIGDPAFKTLIKNGSTPLIPSKIRHSKDTSDIALLRAMKKCYTYDPAKRPRARDIVSFLERAWKSL